MFQVSIPLVVMIPYLELNILLHQVQIHHSSPLFLSIIISAVTIISVELLITFSAFKYIYIDTWYIYLYLHFVPSTTIITFFSLPQFHFLDPANYIIALS